MESVHIFGLNHFLQNIDARCHTPAGRADEAEQKAGLTIILTEIIITNRVELIAEEARPNQRDLGSALAERHRAAYVDITMPIVEREKRGIRTPGYDRNRVTRAEAYREFERYMFERVAAHDARTVLVMCGRRHMRALEYLFKNEGVEAIVYDINDHESYRGVPVEEIGGGIVGYDREDAD